MATNVRPADNPNPSSALGDVSSPPDAPLAARLRYVLKLEAILGCALVAICMVLAFAPKLIGYSSFVIYSGSMEPAIRTGSVAVAKPTSVTDLRIGDIVAFKRSQQALPTMHRIVDIEVSDGTTFLTFKGDANPQPDPEKVALAGEGSKVIYSVPYVGYFARYAQTQVGRFALVLLPGAALALTFLRQIWAPKNGQ